MSENDFRQAVLAPRRDEEDEAMSGGSHPTARKRISCARGSIPRPRKPRDGEGPGSQETIGSAPARGIASPATVMA